METELESHSFQHWTLGSYVLSTRSCTDMAKAVGSCIATWMARDSETSHTNVRLMIKHSYHPLQLSPPTQQPGESY